MLGTGDFRPRLTFSGLDNWFVRIMDALAQMTKQALLDLPSYDELPWERLGAVEIAIVPGGCVLLRDPSHPERSEHVFTANQWFELADTASSVSRKLNRRGW